MKCYEQYRTEIWRYGHTFNSKSKIACVDQPRLMYLGPALSTYFTPLRIASLSHLSNDTDLLLSFR
jgi:hypothetical protein